MRLILKKVVLGGWNELSGNCLVMSFLNGLKVGSNSTYEKEGAEHYEGVMPSQKNGMIYQTLV